MQTYKIAYAVNKGKTKRIAPYNRGGKKKYKSLKNNRDPTRFLN